LVPELNKVDGDLTLISNTFTSLDLPKLKTVAKTITIGSSNNLSKLGMQELTFVGGALSVGDNPHLTTIDSFPKLNEVDGTVDITGGYDDLQLPSLTDVSIVRSIASTLFLYTMMINATNTGPWRNELANFQQAILM
jgi:hypothetical protein